MVTNKIYDFPKLYPGHIVCLNWVPDSSSVLEFGPATGYMTRALKQVKNCLVTGFEYSPEAAKESTIFCHQMVVGDIEDYSKWTELKSNYDAILFADVLEHLRNPADVLTRARSLLSPSGVLIISIPNIAFWTVRRDLLKGNFDYTDRGILDNTHMRFFTQKTLLAMIDNAGLVIEKMEYNNSFYPGDAFFSRLRLSRLKRKINRILDKLFPIATAYQFLVCCKRSTKREIVGLDSIKQ